MNVERQTILLRRNVSHQKPPIIEMYCQVRRVVTLCILPTFPCPGKGFEGYQHELDVESIFRLPYEKSFILPAENCGMWDTNSKLEKYYQAGVLTALLTAFSKIWYNFRCTSINWKRV
jgi:hypothetical protein